MLLGIVDLASPGAGQAILQAFIMVNQHAPDRIVQPDSQVGCLVERSAVQDGVTRTQRCVESTRPDPASASAFTA
jgi:hypothetical protein